MGRPISAARLLHKLKQQPGRIIQRQHRRTKALLRPAEAQVVGGKTRLPERQRAGWYCKRNRADLPDATAATPAIRPREERHDCPRPTLVVAIVQMVGVWIVEVNSLFDQPQP